MLSNNRILVCNRNPDLLEIIGDVLAAAGYDVVRTSDGRQAIEHLAHVNRPGLVITGMSLEHVSGTELVKIARDQDLDVPFIIYTAGVPPCFRAIKGVEVIDTLSGFEPLLNHVRKLAA